MNPKAGTSCDAFIRSICKSLISTESSIISILSIGITFLTSSRSSLFINTVKFVFLVIEERPLT